MDRLPDVSIKLFGHEYDLGYTRGASGASWLLLINRQTGAALPATAFEGRVSSVREIYVYDVDGILPALKQSGIVEQIGPSDPSLGMKVAKCRIIHDSLYSALEKMELRHEQTKSRECEGHGQ